MLEILGRFSFASFLVCALVLTSACTDADPVAPTVDSGTGGRDAGRDASPSDAPFADSGRDDAGAGDARVDAPATVDAQVDAAAATDAGADGGMLTDAGTDAGAMTDAGTDAGVAADAGFDAGMDAGFDAGTDAGFDAGTDAGFDAGPPPECILPTTIPFSFFIIPGEGATGSASFDFSADALDCEGHSGWSSPHVIRFYRDLNDYLFAYVVGAPWRIVGASSGTLTGGELQEVPVDVDVTLDVENMSSDDSYRIVFRYPSGTDEVRVLSLAAL